MGSKEKNHYYIPYKYQAELFKNGKVIPILEDLKNAFQKIREKIDRSQ